MNYRIFFLSLLAFIGLSDASLGKSLSLIVISDETRLPLRAAIRLEDNSGLFLDSICGADGRFTIQYPDSRSNIRLEVSHDGYIAVWMNLPEEDIVDLGVIALEREPVTLNEVTVVASNTSIKAGKRTIFPTVRQIRRNFNTEDLLSDLRASVPELRVNPILHTISIDDQTPVFQINGRVQNMDRLISLSPERIARIEMTNYRDPQYNAPVFNIILKPAPKGGSVAIYSQDAVTTPKVYAKTTGTFNRKNSEVLFDYKWVYRNSSDEITNSTESYTDPFSKIVRNGQGLPSATTDQDHRFLFEYTYMPGKKSVFVLSAEAALHWNHNENGIKYIQTSGLSEERDGFISWNNRKYRRTPWGFSGYYRFEKNIHRVEVLTSIVQAGSRYNRELNYSDGYNYQSNSVNRGLSCGATVNYYIQFPSDISLSSGVDYSYNLAESEFFQSGYPDNNSRMHSNQVYAYGKISWYNKGFSIVGGPGIRYLSSYNGVNSDKYWNWRGVIAVNQNVGQFLSLSYNAAVDPGFPSLGETSTVLQIRDDYSGHIGNPYLKPSLGLSQNFRINYHSKKIRVSPYAYYAYKYLPIVEDWYYSYDDELFVQTYENADDSHNLTFALNVSLSDIFGKINLAADIGCNRFWLRMNEASSSKCHMFVRFNASAYINDFNFSLDLTPIRGLQYQGAAYSREMVFNSISASYRYRNFQFGIQWQNPLTSKAFLTQTYYLSKVHPRYNEYYISDFNNMILFSVQYNASFGHSYKKPNVTTYKTAVKDIITAY